MHNSENSESYISNYDDKESLIKHITSIRKALSPSTPWSVTSPNSSFSVYGKSNGSNSSFVQRYENKNDNSTLELCHNILSRLEDIDPESYADDRSLTNISEVTSARTPSYPPRFRSRTPVQVQVQDRNRNRKKNISGVQLFSSGNLGETRSIDVFSPISTLNSSIMSDSNNNTRKSLNSSIEIQTPKPYSANTNTITNTNAQNTFNFRLRQKTKSGTITLPSIELLPLTDENEKSEQKQINNNRQRKPMKKSKQ